MRRWHVLLLLLVALMAGSVPVEAQQRRPDRWQAVLDNGDIIWDFRLVKLDGDQLQVRQSLELLRHRPDGFSVLTGEDAYFYTLLAHGGDGGILASAHVGTADFLAVYERMSANDHHGALRAWARLEPVVPLLFQEPNPMPIKHCLRRRGLIVSAECRLPLTRVSAALAERLDAIPI